jgi:hypothetical protein
MLLPSGILLIMEERRQRETLIWTPRPASDQIQFTHLAVGEACAWTGDRHIDLGRTACWDGRLPPLERPTLERSAYADDSFLTRDRDRRDCACDGRRADIRRALARLTFSAGEQPNDDHEAKKSHHARSLIVALAKASAIRQSLVEFNERYRAAGRWKSSITISA